MHLRLRRALLWQPLQCPIIEVDIAANAAIDMEVVCPDGMWVVYGSGARQFSLPFLPMISPNILVRFFIVYHQSAYYRQRERGPR